MFSRWKRRIRIEAGALLLGRPGFLRRLYDHFFSGGRFKAASVVIWGRHSPEWHQALDPKAPLWRRLRHVGAVFVRSSDKPEIPVCAGFGRRVVVIPLMEPHTLMRPREHLALVGSDNAVKMLGDKARFAEYCRRRGLSEVCPASYATFEEARFPCVLKRSDLNNGEGVEIVESAAHGQRLLASERFAGKEWILQEHIRFNVDYTIHCVCIGGRIRWHATYAFLLDSPQIRTREIGDLRRVETPAQTIPILEALLVPLNYSGPCNVDCTWDADGKLKIFEINPRLGGSLMRPQNVADLEACLSVMIAEALALPRGVNVSLPARVVSVRYTENETGIVASEGEPAAVVEADETEEMCPAINR